MEEVVAREFDRLCKTLDDVPEDEAFRDDVLTYALNRLPPRYVARRTGAVVTNLSLASDQEMARVSVVLMEALRVVRAAPDEESFTGAKKSS